MKTDQRLRRVLSSSSSGGPITISYKVQPGGGRVDVTLPFATTRCALIRRLRQAADEIEAAP